MPDRFLSPMIKVAIAGDHRQRRSFGFHHTDFPLRLRRPRAEKSWGEPDLQGILDRTKPPRLCGVLPNTRTRNFSRQDQRAELDKHERQCSAAISAWSGHRNGRCRRL